MNINREQFLKAVERGESLFDEFKQDYPDLKLKPVFSRFGPRCGQCDLTTDLRKIVMEFSEMLAGEDFNRERAQKTQKGDVQRLRDLLFEIKGADKETLSPSSSLRAGNLRKNSDEIERRLLDPDLKLYCGDVLIEFRPGVLKYESLRLLQQDSRLPPGMNEVGNVRVIAGLLELMAN